MLTEKGCRNVELMADMLGASFSAFYRFKACVGIELSERRLRRQALAEREVFNRHMGL